MSITSKIKTFSKVRLKSLFKPAIPHRIIVTDKTIPQAYLNQLQLWNQNWEIRFFDDAACRGFIAKHFSADVVHAYDKVLPGAYKADLFRYCALYILGGVYTDTHIPYERGFSEIWKLEKGHIFLMKDRGKNQIQISTMAAPPRCRFFQLCINACTENILASYYGESPLAISGPLLAGQCFQFYTGKKKIKLGTTSASKNPKEPAIRIDYALVTNPDDVAESNDFSENIAKAFFINKNKETVFNYKMNPFRQHYNHDTHYWRAWNSRKVFKENSLPEQGS